MKRRLFLATAILMAFGVAGLPARAETIKPAAEKPEPPEKLVDPAGDALQTYLFDQNNDNLLTKNKTGEIVLKDIIHVSKADKADYAIAVVDYMLASRTLEKKAVEKFGEEDGLHVQGHVRSYADQYKLDLKRVRDANIQYNADKTAATIYLRVELHRPENLQIGDRFNFLDVYEMTKTSTGWKLDFLKTYKCLDPDQEDNYKLELLAFPRMSDTLKALSAGLSKGTIKTADDVKNELDTKWSHVYDEPVRRALKPGETMPADATPADTAPAPAPAHAK